MNIMFFLGSGISFPSELPNVNQITESLLNDEWFDHSDLTFIQGKHPSEYFRKQNFVLSHNTYPSTTTNAPFPKP